MLDASAIWEQMVIEAKNCNQKIQYGSITIVEWHCMNKRSTEPRLGSLTPFKLKQIEMCQTFNIF